MKLFNYTILKTEEYESTLIALEEARRQGTRANDLAFKLDVAKTERDAYKKDCKKLGEELLQTTNELYFQTENNCNLQASNELCEIKIKELENKIRELKEQIKELQPKKEIKKIKINPEAVLDILEDAKKVPVKKNVKKSQKKIKGDK